MSYHHANVNETCFKTACKYHQNTSYTILQINETSMISSCNCQRNKSYAMLQTSTRQYKTYNILHNAYQWHVVCLLANNQQASILECLLCDCWPNDTHHDMGTTFYVNNISCTSWSCQHLSMCVTTTKLCVNLGWCRINILPKAVARVYLCVFKI